MGASYWSEGTTQEHWFAIRELVHRSITWDKNFSFYIFLNNCTNYSVLWHLTKTVETEAQIAILTFLSSEFQLLRFFNFTFASSLSPLCFLTVTAFNWFCSPQFVLYFIIYLLWFLIGLLKAEKQGNFYETLLISHKSCFLSHLALSYFLCHAHVHNIQCLWKLYVSIQYWLQNNW